LRCVELQRLIQDHSYLNSIHTNITDKDLRTDKFADLFNLKALHKKSQNHSDALRL
jgi:hypothetical protein